MKYKLIFADAIEYAFDELIIPNRPIGYLNFIRQQIITDGYVKDLISYVNGLYYNYDSKHEMFKKRNITKDKFEMDLELIKNTFAKRIPGQVILAGQVRDTSGSRQGRERDF